MAQPRELTPRQKELLNFIEDMNCSEHRMPSYREMAKALKLAAVGSVQDLVSALIEKKYLSKNGRHLALSEKRQTSIVNVPIVGVVAAGNLQEAIENNMGVMTLSAELFKPRKSRGLFALKVDGESMVEAGILDGDFVVVQSQADYKAGDTVVARFEGEATVKELYFKGKDIILHPRNSSLSDIVIPAREAAKLEILGRVVAVQRIF